MITAAQTTVFAQAGCVITELNLVQPELSFQPLEEVAETIRGADIILVSGGNPLFAVALWCAFPSFFVGLFIGFPLKTERLSSVLLDFSLDFHWIFH